MLDAAVAAMAEALRRTGNASSLHSAGRRARRAVEEARERIAAAVGARPSEVVLTTGGTESDNLAVKGLYWARRAADPRRTRVLVVGDRAPRRARLGRLAGRARGCRGGAARRSTTSAGCARRRCARRWPAEPERVALVSVMWANNEVGTVNPMRELAGDRPRVRRAAAHRRGAGGGRPAGRLRRLRGRRADAHRAQARRPYRRRRAAARPRGRAHPAAARRRAGAGRALRAPWTRPAVVGLATAVELAVADAPRRAATLAGLRDDLIGKVLAAVPDATLNGDPGTGVIDGGPSRLPGNAHLSFPGCEGDSLLMLLDAHGIECSTGSACTAGVAQPSHVLLAMGADEATARGSLRFSLGHTSTPADVDAVAAVIGPVVDRARRAGRSAASRRPVGAGR